MAPTVSERLIGGTVALIAADGGHDLSVRRLAEASERSTMCVYTHFQGRANLLLAAHREAAQEFVAAVDAAGDPVDGLRAAARDRPTLLLWLLTVADTPALRTVGAEFAATLLSRLAAGQDDSSAREVLGAIVGAAVLAPLLPDGSQSRVG